MSKQVVQVKNEMLKYIRTVQVSKYVAFPLSELYMEVGPPKVLQADNGGEFKKTVEKLYKNPAVKIVRSSPYHPQSKGKVERSPRALRKKMHLIWHTLIEIA